jgi:hypothetical protein
LETRCNAERKEQIHDGSVNCRSVEEFAAAATLAVRKLRRAAPIQARFLPYVATNERNESALDYLRKKGFLLFSDLESALQPRLSAALPLNPLNQFLLEVLLMCRADHFVFWGFSEVHNFVKKCRADRAVQLQRSRADVV